MFNLWASNKTLLIQKRKTKFHNSNQNKRATSKEFHLWSFHRDIISISPTPKIEVIRETKNNPGRVNFRKLTLTKKNFMHYHCTPQLINPICIHSLQRMIVWYYREPRTHITFNLKNQQANHIWVANKYHLATIFLIGQRSYIWEDPNHVQLSYRRTDQQIIYG